MKVETDADRGSGVIWIPACAGTDGGNGVVALSQPRMTPPFRPAITRVLDSIPRMVPSSRDRFTGEAATRPRFFG